MGRGTVDHVPVYPREIVKRALELDASALILIHNHPSGDPTPSQQNIAMTERIVSAADAVGITVDDHFVIGKSSEVSFRSESLILRAQISIRGTLETLRSHVDGNELVKERV